MKILISTQLSLVTPYDDMYSSQRCPGSGLLPDVTKPLPVPMLTSTYLVGKVHLYNCFHTSQGPMSLVNDISH